MADHAREKSSEPSSSEASASITTLIAEMREADIRARVSISGDGQAYILNAKLLTRWIDKLDALLIACRSAPQALSALDDALIRQLHTMSREDLLEWISARYREGRSAPQETR